MTNWKTSLFGTIASAPTILNLIGLTIPEPVSNAMFGIGGLVAWILAKDYNVKGGTKEQ